MKNLKRKSGFTLIELIVVMGILAVLVAMGAPKFLGYIKDAKVTAMKADTKILEQAGMQYSLENDDAFPLADADADGNPDPFTVTDTEVLKVVNADGVAASGDEIAVYEIDATKAGDYIRSLKGKYTDFVMTADGTVYSKVAVEGRDGSFYTGLTKIN